MKILVTGAAGFIGFHLVKRLLKEGHQVIGLDNVNDYYSIDLKYARLLECGIQKQYIHYNHLTQSDDNSAYQFILLDLEDRENLFSLFKKEAFHVVYNLAAQAGVRYSLENPFAYIGSNINGFLAILEACRQYPVQHLLYASSSSVYGSNEKVPFREQDNTDHPVSLYAATKKSNELMAHCYSSLYNIPVTGLRFFTVYGPWGRPDMAPSLFMDAIVRDEIIRIFNYGDMMRDFTFIDDVIESLFRLLSVKPVPSPDFDPKNPDPSFSSVPYRIYNVGNSSSVKLLDFLGCYKSVLGIEIKMELLPMQPGDVVATYADTTKLNRVIDYTPSTSYIQGITNFITWYLTYYDIKMKIN